MDVLAPVDVTSLRRPAIPAAILAGRVVAVGRRLDPYAIPQIADALEGQGIRAFEITFDSRGALEAIGKLARRHDPAHFVVGAGTVFSVEVAAEAVAAGAQFIVMPHCGLDIIRWSLAHEVPCFAGALTPTEAFTAWRAGAAAVKLFPASAVGPAFIREMRGPFPDIPLVPTGGITLENASTFLNAGAAAIGIGSWLIANGDLVAIRDRARQLLDTLMQR